MSDIFDQLQEVNPVDAEELHAAVALDPDQLIAAVTAESESPFAASTRRRRDSTVVARTVYAGAGALAAAAVAVLVFAGMRSIPAEVSTTDSAGLGQEAEVAEPDRSLVVDVPTDDDPATGIGTERIEESSAAVESSAPGAANSEPGHAARFDVGRDLLSLHYDHAPDRDDGHATVAGREITAALGIDPHVVGGTYGLNRADYDASAELVMRETWGRDWLNAHADRAGSVTATAERWLAVLDGGGDIWVAEGGQSDFTAEVVSEMRRRRPDLDTRSRITVVQPSSPQEAQTSPEGLQYVIEHTTYVPMADDGVFAADLTRSSETFVDAALAGRHNRAWSVAFEYLDPATRLDFSDTVAALYIVGIDVDEVANAEDFARRFMR